jgi:hypothetical protein
MTIHLEIKPAPHHTIHSKYETADEAIVYILTRYPGDFRKVDCLETKKHIISSLENTLDFYHCTIKKIPVITHVCVNNMHEIPSDNLLEKLNEIFTLFPNDNDTEEMFLHYSKNVERYLLNKFEKTMKETTIFPDKPNDIDGFISQESHIVIYEGKKYYFIVSIETGDYVLYGLIYNEDKELISGIRSQDDSYNYDFYDIPPHVLPLDLKREIKYIAGDVLPG